ncbi:TPA: hypothetical protein QCR58_000378 [Bacillus cereus]|uniref:hypothetical protein n=1 Tax=Bacillus TaxID=1386 RepID=UPI001F5A2296|nr:hypothetical protein [Bacillus sp. DAG6]EKS7842634.1 hypothetical protein [Bacillus cereus]MCU4730112.1 hypothetical protein [Bacillus cereus]MDA2605731.1 hypothetical protein [Bacillus cereus]MEB2640705.1 hypothetical protein [Bacillus sp. DAG6]HDR4540675.1 hypothetical protein [Bacillus cereus]
MIDIIFSFFLVVTYFIIYLFSSGEKKQQAKENLKEVITGADGKLLLVTFVGIVVGGIFLYFYTLSL